MPSQRFIVTGTDTGIGKTVFSAALTQALQASYWKPVQAGLETETDSGFVQRLTTIPSSRIIPEAYRLHLPASPHLAAQREGISISLDRLSLPSTDAPLVVEGAGGVLVPLSTQHVYADLFAQWKVPVILCARTSLGTINHTLLSLEALRHRNIAVHGVAFIGEEQSDTQSIIQSLGKVRILGRLPILENLDSATLAQAFDAHFKRADFTGEL